MELPHFSETEHPLIQSLYYYSDEELLNHFQNYPEHGKYFTAIFCRYYPIVYSLIANSHPYRSGIDYLFALTWRQFFYEMRGLVLQNTGNPEFISLQNWIIYMTAVCLQEKELPTTKSINYDLKTTSPPLWCYLEQVLAQLPGIMRFIVVMTEKFQWNTMRITAYLQSEGEQVSPKEVDILLKQGYEMLESALPEDIRKIYLESEE